MRADDFEVSIFLTDLLTRHALLTKQKVFRDKNGGIKSNSGKLTGWVTKGGMTNEDAIDVEEAEDTVAIRQESDEENDGIVSGATRTAKRRRAGNEDEDSLFIEDDVDVSEDEGFQKMEAAPQSKRRRKDGEDDGEDGEDDKKKLGLNTSYDGFSIYGRILCLVVKKKGGSKGRIPGASADQAGQQMLENWVSTQAAQEGMMDDGD